MDVIVKRGTNPRLATYSIFRDSQNTLLDGMFALQAHQVTDLYFVGVGLERGIYRAAVDALLFGFQNVTILEDASIAIDLPSWKNAKKVLTSRGVRISSFAQLISSFENAEGEAIIREHMKKSLKGKLLGVLG